MMNTVTLTFLVIGLLFNIFGVIGLIRFPDIYNRLQSSTKCVTLGTCSILLSLLFQFGFNEASVKALLAIPLLFFTATVAAHALVRGSYIHGVPLGKKSVKDDYQELHREEITAE